jgi:galactonate dehydratase
MKRRCFLGTLAAGGAGLGAHRLFAAAPPPMKITRIRAYRPPRFNPTFNQANLVVAVETDAGITGIGEGGSKEMLEQCASMLIGQNPSQIEPLWQFMFRGWFYPPGREKLHALGALDVALWDIKGKALNLPVYELLGGLARDHFECYGYGRGKTVQESARACMEAGFRCYRAVCDYWNRDTARPVLGTPPGRLFNSRIAVRQTIDFCRQVREGVGPDGDWLIDFHTRLDLADAIHLCSAIQELDPFEVEDPLRSEAPEVYAALRQAVKTPLAVGEQFGARWDMHKLIENQWIDYVRATIPNVGGITEWMKIQALCETHSVGVIPHNTGPISTAALVHACGPFSGPVMFEQGGPPGEPPYLPQSFDFKNGKVWPNRRPGIGVTFEPAGLEVVLDVNKPSAPIPIYRRPDGSLTNW